MSQRQCCNPARQKMAKTFLKRNEEHKCQPETRKDHLLSWRAVSIKDRCRSSAKLIESIEPSRKFVEVAVETEQVGLMIKQREDKLFQQKQNLAKRLRVKESQYIQLNLKYIALKEKYDTITVKNSNLIRSESISDFGDISNISQINNTTLSRKNKGEELNAIKQRLKRVDFAKLLLQQQKYRRNSVNN